MCSLECKCTKAKIPVGGGGKSHYNPFIESIKCHIHPLESLKVPMWLSEAVILRKTDNAMVKEK